MAIKLIANYSKRLGLPGYSSHQFSVSVETELAAGGDVTAEAERLYQVLQSSVDEQIQTTGFVPPAGYGCSGDGEGAASSGWRGAPTWKCSVKQRDLILGLVEEHQLDKKAVDDLAQRRFSKGVRQLNKMEASGLIDELLETYGGSRRPRPEPVGRRAA